MKYHFEEKLNLVRLLKVGYPLKRLSREKGIADHQLRVWLKSYELYGEEGLRHRTRGYHFRPEEKRVVVRDFLEKGIPLSELCLRHGLNRTTIQGWCRKVRQHGYEVLLDVKRRGRPPKDHMRRPKKKEPQTELEKLQAENLRLRAENALLKKVKALVEEQEARAQLNGQKPSTN